MVVGRPGGLVRVDVACHFRTDVCWLRTDVARAGERGRAVIAIAMRTIVSSVVSPKSCKNLISVSSVMLVRTIGEYGENTRKSWIRDGGVYVILR